MRPVTRVVWGLLCVAAAANAQPVAERVTAGNAAARLFGGTDAAGGIGDWYVSNGVVEAVVDGVGPQDDLVALIGSAAPPKQSSAAATGGTLVDLGLVGRDNDQLGQMFSVAGLSSDNTLRYQEVTASVAGDTATVTARGVVDGFDTGATPIPADDLEAVTTYAAGGTDPFLTVTTTITNRHPTNAAAGLGAVLDPIIWTQRGIVPFSPLPERGFRHGVLDLANPLVALEQPAFAAGPGSVGPGDGTIDPVTGAAANEVAYGLLGVEVSVDQDGDGPGAPVVTPVDRLFGVSNNTTTALGNLPATATLQPGGVLRYTRRLYVGARNDVASVANPILQALAARQGFATGTISGDVDASDGTDVAASVIVTRTGTAAGTIPAGSPVTQVRTDAAGAFGGVVLPAGTYDLAVSTPERTTVTVAGVAVSAGTDTPVTIPPLAAVGTVRLRALEVRPGRDRPVPARVVFHGVKGTADPRFRKDVDASLIDPGGGPDIDLLPESFGGGPALGNVVLLGNEPVEVQVRPGVYELIAARGPEYGAQRLRLKVRAGRRRQLTFKLKRVLDTEGFLSGDFHVHSARSFDASAPLRDRVIGYAGEGVEVIVSTDHDFHVDYRPVIEALGLEDRIASIVGDEVTTAVPNPPSFPASIGHLNGWPVQVAPDARKDGAIEDELVAPNVLYSRLRAAGAEVVQYNHPRDTLSGLTSLGFFTNIAYDPDLPLSSAPNDVLLDRDVLGPGRTGVANPDGFRNLDFDVLEVANGLSIPMLLRVRRDWLSLLNQTDFTTVPFIPATGVSDSHRLTVETPGYFRTFVGGAGNDPAGLAVSAFDQQVKAGNMTVGNGPFVLTRVETADGGSGAGLGGTLATAGGDVVLDVRVEAPPWIPVDEVRVIANGFVVMTFDRTTSPAVRPAPKNPYSRSTRRVVRFAERIPVTVTRDTYFVVEAGAPLDTAPAAPEPAALLVPGLVPLGFTNPVFVDLGADGFSPPGLPVMATASGAGESLPAFARVGHRMPAPRRAERGTPVPSGPAQHAAMMASRDRATADYFPVFHFRLPPP